MNDFLKEIFGLLCKPIHQQNDEYRFGEIVGHDDIKLIFQKATLSKKPVHLLLIGSSGSAKTMFLTEIMRHEKPSYFIVGSNTTKAGLVNQLFERRPKFLLIDELEKMNVIDQTALLHLMETGIISETKFKKTRQMDLTSWVFATANGSEKIINPLLSRFAVLEMPEYTFEEFYEIAVTKLKKEGIHELTAKLIVEKVWNELDSKDIRDVMKVSRLANSSQDVSFVVKMLNKKKHHINRVTNSTHQCVGK